jgi:hypothetical protein
MPSQRRRPLPDPIPACGMAFPHPSACTPACLAVGLLWQERVS